MTINKELKLGGLPNAIETEMAVTIQIEKVKTISY